MVVADVTVGGILRLLALGIVGVRIIAVVGVLGPIVVGCNRRVVFRVRWWLAGVPGFCLVVGSRMRRGGRSLPVPPR